MSSTRVSKSKNKTICETSKIVAYSLIKASSFTLSKLALNPPPPLRTRTQPSNSVSVEAVQELKPATKSESTRYVEAESSSKEIDKRSEIDKRAAEYILRIRAKNMSEQIVEFKLPPPTTAKATNSYSHAL